MDDFNTLKLNEKGDTLAGFSGLLILIWVVTATLIQRQELKQALTDFKRLSDAAEAEMNERQEQASAKIVTQKVRSLERKLGRYCEIIKWDRVVASSGSSIFDDGSQKHESIVLCKKVSAETNVEGELLWEYGKRISNTRRLLELAVHQGSLSTKSPYADLLQVLIDDCNVIGTEFGEMPEDQIARFNDIGFWDLFEDLEKIKNMDIWIR